VIKGTGTLEPYIWHDLEAAAPGFVTDVMVQTGDRIEADQPLAVVQSDSLERVLVRVRREERYLRTAMGRAYSRGDALEGNKFQDRLHRSETDRRELEELQDRLLVRVPYSGVVLTPAVENLRHEWTSQGRLLMTVGNVDSLLVRIEVHERELADLERGTQVRFKSPANGWVVTRGHVVAIDLVGEQNISEEDVLKRGASYRVEMVLDNTEANLLPGQTGRVRLYGKRRSLWAQFWRSSLQTLRLDFFI
jgi:multidrug efflux pump subunit AcrA (membrane-fusion protein)